MVVATSYLMAAGRQLRKLIHDMHNLNHSCLRLPTNSRPNMKPILIALLTLLATCAPKPATAALPRPEHPRPDAFRDNWASLNGPWQWEHDANADGEARGLISGKDLAGQITVPFCPESKLSGVAQTGIMKHTWYRRFFDVPPAMQGQRVRLHFGAVDYTATVWVNGRRVGAHTGGSAAFAFDITKTLRAGSNEVVVHVFDDTASGRQPAGKQSFTVSEGCVYTRTTGIWQPVWLEAVGSSFVESVSLVPDPDRSRVLIDATINGADPNLTLTAEAFTDGKSVGKETRPVQWRNNRLVVSLSKKRL